MARGNGVSADFQCLRAPIQMDDSARFVYTATLLACGSVPGKPNLPAVPCIRSVDFPEPLVSRRTRFWLTSFDHAGELIALGWRDGLRIVSEVRLADSPMFPGNLGSSVRSLPERCTH